jgi:hypothetical protein
MQQTVGRWRESPSRLRRCRAGITTRPILSFDVLSPPRPKRRLKHPVDSVLVGVLVGDNHIGRASMVQEEHPKSANDIEEGILRAVRSSLGGGAVDQ